jgi:hypothetical protein
MQNTMSRKKTSFWLGLVIYAVSFALVAVADRGPSRGLIRGYWAAIFPIWIPLLYNPFQAAWLFHDRKFDYVALLISGWINPLFLITLTLALLRRYKRAIAILRIILLLMFPFCWVVFYSQGFYPREGHLLCSLAWSWRCFLCGNDQAAGEKLSRLKQVGPVNC